MSRSGDLYFEFQKSQTQYAYFQLGVAASAIAFAVHQTREMSLEEAPSAWGVAVFLWGLSFALGCSGIGSRNKGLQLNVGLLFAEERAPNVWLPTIRGSTEWTEWRKDIENSVSSSYIKFRLQLWSLFIGSLSYVVGHLSLMAAR